MDRAAMANLQTALGDLRCAEGRPLEPEEMQAIRELMKDPQQAASKLAPLLEGSCAGDRGKYLFTHLLAEAARLTPATSQEARRELGNALIALPHELRVAIIMSAGPAAEEGWFGLLDVISDLPATELAPAIAEHMRESPDERGVYDLLNALSDGDARLIALESATMGLLEDKDDADQAGAMLQSAVLELLTDRTPSEDLDVPEQVGDSSLLLAELIGRLGVPDAQLAARLSSVSALRVAMQQQQQIYAAALDGTSDGVLVFAHKGRVLISNPTAARILGLPESELRQQTFLLIVSRVLEISMEDAEEIADTVMTSGEPYVAEAEFEDTGHSYAVTINGIASEIAGPLALVVTFADVTHFREMARMKDDLISITTHELRSPLTSIRGFAEILLEEDGQTDEQHEFLEAIHRQSLRLGDIVNDFLDLSRLESERDVLVREAADVGLLIGRVVADLQPQADEKGIRVTFSEAESLPSVQLDASKMEQVMTNLLANAIKYSSNDASVEISAFVEEGSLRLSVADTGYGIPKPDVEHVFEKFYRAHDDRTQQSRGTGLGLSLVNAIVEAHGGTVDVQSEVDVGSTFICRIPLDLPEEEAPQT